MSTTLTPSVFFPIFCFSCLSSSKTGTYFLVDGKKASNDDLKQKLCWVFGGSIPQNIGEKGRLCRSCYLKLEKAWKLRCQMINASNSENVNVGIEVQVFCKRVAVLPTSIENLDSDIDFEDDNFPCKKVRLDSDFKDLGDHEYDLKREICKDSKNDCENLSKPHARQQQKSENPAGINSNIVSCITRGDYEAASVLLQQHSQLWQEIKCRISFALEEECSSLGSKTMPFSSVLWKYSQLHSLIECDDIIKDIYKEMKERVPFLVKIFRTIAVSPRLTIDKNHIAVMASAYSMLMKSRNPTLSAWHKMTTCIALEGNIDDSALTILNRLGLMMSPTTKLKMQDDFGHRCHDNIIDILKENPLIKITGDNLDVFVRAAHQASDKQNRDLHLFASNIIFCKSTRPDMDNTASCYIPKTEDMFLSDADRSKLTNSYRILIGRILLEIPEFQWMKRFIPNHIRHGTYGDASRKSQVFQLPLQFKNEAKHDDCLDIMDTYEEQLQNIFRRSHGNIQALEDFQVAVGGDQLTRIRLQEVKELRSLAPDATSKLDHLQPIVCEWWHNKQDFLEKAYKALYKPSSFRQEGSLYNLKIILQLGSVNGKVKTNFQAHHDLLIQLTKHLILEQAHEYLEQNHPGEMAYTKKEFQEAQTIEVLSHIINAYGYIQEPSDNHPVQEDEVFNYFMNICHWGLHLMQLDDTAKEADGERSIVNAKYNIPFFFSHSHLSKYMVENILYVRQSMCLSPLQRSRMLDCAFVNIRGGCGNSVEADLVQEHHVNNQKKLIKQLGANKTEKAILRATSAAHSICTVTEHVSSSLGISVKSNRHCKRISPADSDIIRKTLRKVRPFRFTPGRKTEGFHLSSSTPFAKFSKKKLYERISHILQRLTWGQTVHVNEEDVEDEALFGYVPI